MSFFKARKFSLESSSIRISFAVAFSIPLKQENLNTYDVAASSHPRYATLAHLMLNQHKIKNSDWGNPTTKERWYDKRRNNVVDDDDHREKRREMSEKFASKWMAEHEIVNMIHTFHKF